MKRYIGIDPHQASCTVAVLTETGKRLSMTVVETNGEALVTTLCSIRGERHLVIEEGQYANWLYEILSPHVHTSMVAFGTGEKGPKTDGIDATKLADGLRLGTLHRVYKGKRQCKLRTLAHVYLTTKQDMVRSKNRLKGYYRSRGVMVTGKDIYAEVAATEYVCRLPEPAQQAASTLHAYQRQLLQSKSEAETAFIAEAKQHPLHAKLCTVPGIGAISAAQLIAYVQTPHRFATKRHFWSYCGFGIVMRTSSDWKQDTQTKGWQRKPVIQTRGLNRKRHPVLKQIFKNAATVSVGPRGNQQLREKYDALCEAGTKPNLAKLTIARRIAAIVLTVMKENREFTEAKPPAKRP